MNVIIIFKSAYIQNYIQHNILISYDFLKQANKYLKHNKSSDQLKYFKHILNITLFIFDSIKKYKERIMLNF